MNSTKNNEDAVKTTIDRQGRLSAVTRSNEIALLIILIVLCVAFSFVNGNFYKLSNLMNITRQIAIVLVIGIGMLCIVLTGEIDLSVGSVAALAGVASAATIVQTGSIPLGLLAGVVIGTLAGLVNGVLVVYGRMPSFIVTLASMEIWRGVVMVWTGGRPISNLPDAFGVFGASYIGGVVPTASIIAVVIMLIAFFFIHKTKHGIYLKAIGASSTAAGLSAIPVKKYKIVTFLVSGATAAIGGIMTASKLLSAQPTACDGMEMDVLTAVILGGASLSGGVGSVAGTLIGALTIGIINNGMNLANINSYYQQVVKGVIIVVAVLIKTTQKGRKK